MTLGYYGTSTFVNNAIEAVSSINVKIAREVLKWDIVEAQKGSYDWSRYDYLFNKYSSKNIDILLCIMNESPSWANGDSNKLIVPTGTAFDSWVNSFSNFIRSAVTRYKGIINKWEIGNEPGDIHFWPSGPSVSQYTAWYRALYETIKNESPKAIIVAPGVTNVGGCGGSQMWPGGGPGFIRDFYIELIKLGAERPDVISIHPYCDIPLIHEQYKNNWDDIAGIHNLLKKMGDGDKKIWLTEFGWKAGTDDEQKTAGDYMRKSILSLINNYPYVDLYTYFMGYDTPSYSDGLFSVNGDTFTPKIHANIFKELTKK